MKKLFLLLVLFIAVLGLTSCSDYASSGIPKEEINGKNQNDSEKTTIAQFGEKEALALRNKAMNHYFNVLDGGSDCKDQQKSTPVSEDYFYNFCDDLDTIDKLTVYLEEVFTKEITSDFIRSSDYKIINNKLSYQSLGWGSLNDWEKATVKLVADNGNAKSFEFTVPSAEESMGDTIINIKFIYVLQKGWRIASQPRNIM
ncbi:IseA DL-endopeptidase inhibitor family protein [Paenibacillus oleatilyticus]|uniref:IseA DL-endopeptidase inhibitor family protein n=1 Tax=Paenibacillus oleatilyticus TaxID=2594886 RepID=UPI001C1F782C|nr:IseA DL-endopeptidase inhibitor family protein [Paenibacillus oleatilyticus]MBU7314289.1 IseA DL-endopeptidase inhibitor family protein [Paenibacillus oleatilyticus]